MKTILAIETSCDETAAAVLQKEGSNIKILSSVVASSASLQAKYGGIIPEQAAREQIKSIIPVISEAISESQLKVKDIDAIAITQGPGLIGSLLVGVETAKTLSQIWDKPLIPVNHLIGHFYANWINLPLSLRAQAKQFNIKIAASTSSPRNDKNQLPTFPCLGLLVSGGHSDLVLFKNHGLFSYLGGTRDDAAGECFDKSARILGLSYPGGPEISKRAKLGNPKSYNLPRPLIDSKDYDFSFSGLKTAVANLVEKTRLNNQTINNLCASIEMAIVDSLIRKVSMAIDDLNSKELIVAGGVAANQKLKDELEKLAKMKKIKLFIPPSILCTDNAAMIASAAFFLNPTEDPLKLQANPNLSLAY